MAAFHLDFEALLPLIARLAAYLYGQGHRGTSFDRAEIVGALLEDAASIDQALRRLNTAGIIEYDERRERIDLRPWGRYCHEHGCVTEVVFGLGYSDMKYAKAVVRIVFRLGNGDEAAGSGFFVADPVNCIITNRHVAENATIQVESMESEVLFRGPQATILGPEELDLAVIRCPLPDDVTPIRIDWDPQSARPLDPVLVLGYPYVANHEPALHHAQGVINMIARRMVPAERNSLIISDAAGRGCSGGPIINIKGMAVGVVAREEEAQREGAAPERFLSAIPILYIRDFLQRE
jgi:S1-C subfamily serine protease